MLALAINKIKDINKNEEAPISICLYIKQGIHHLADNLKYVLSHYKEILKQR